MKQKASFSVLQKRTKLPYMAALFFGLVFLLTSCFLKQDRTTTVYGTITDQNGQSVDSILVLISGLEFYRATTLKEIYSDEQGNYEVVVDVPKKFDALNVIIPSFPTKNPKFQKNYNGYGIRKNDDPTNNCCMASVGEKTKYDFQLISK
jgi:hypothetical protein